MTDTKDPDMQMAMMAECMTMVRQDLIDMGIIDKSVAPMFVAEAVAAAFMAAKQEARHEAAGELALQYTTVLRFLKLLEGVAIALKGPQEPDTAHSWHDLPKLAAEARQEALRFAACRHQARHMQEDGGEPAFIKGIDLYRRQNKLE